MSQLSMAQNKAWPNKAWPDESLVSACYLLNQPLPAFPPVDTLQFLQKPATQQCKKHHQTGYMISTNHVPDQATHHTKMYVTVEKHCVTALRRIVMNTFNSAVSSIRIQPIEHARKMKVCLCFVSPVEDKLMAAIMRNLPSAEFGRISIVEPLRRLCAD